MAGSAQGLARRVKLESGVKEARKLWVHEVKAKWSRERGSGRRQERPAEELTCDQRSGRDQTPPVCHWSGKAAARSLQV